jgi:hypothetical protein
VRLKHPFIEIERAAPGPAHRLIGFLLRSLARIAMRVHMLGKVFFWRPAHSQHETAKTDNRQPENNHLNAHKTFNALDTD